MRKHLVTTCLFLLNSLPAWAEPGTIAVSPGQPTSVIESARIESDRANTYAITVGGDQDGRLRFEVRPHHRSVSPDLRLFDADGGTIMQAYGGEGGKVLRADVVITPGTYTLEVANSYGNAQDKPYRLETSFAPANDRYERNDTFETAKPLALGQPAAFNLLKYGPDGDVDYFLVEHKGGVLVADITPLQNVSPVVTVYNAAREEVGAEYAGGGGALHGEWELPAGKYYLKVTDSYSENVLGTLNLTVTAK